MLRLNRKGKFSLFALRQYKRYIVEEQITHVACVNLYPLLYAHAAMWALGRQAPAVTALINTTDFPTRRAERQMLVYAPLLRRTKQLIFGCHLQRDQWIVRYRLSSENSRVIYNGVDQNYYSTAAIPQTREELRQLHAVPQHSFVAITVGVLRPEKQHGHFVEAVAALVSRGLPIYALIVGEGSQRPIIENCIANLGMGKHVRLLGQISDVRPLLKLADAFVLTSTSVETFSNAALEAMAMGLPVILSRIGGAAEMVEPGWNGLLYPSGEIDVLTDNLAALASDVGLARRMGEAARTRVQERFGFTRMVEDYRYLLFPS
jgi:glycosyltransferase involved in cell wall biosynthesis